MEFDFLNNLATGFTAAATFKNIGLALLGCLLGTLIGVLPGIGPIPTIAILLPITFQLDPLGSLVMLAGIYYGAQYGGSTTSILVNMPGEASSIVTCIDGYQIARQGRAGRRSGLRRSAPSLREPSVRFSSPRSGRPCRRWRSNSTRRTISP
jgi:putative tricarboxylic transport membrane protein